MYAGRAAPNELQALLAAIRGLVYLFSLSSNMIALLLMLAPRSTVLYRSTIDFGASITNIIDIVGIPTSTSFTEK